jgi:hypothetical protein
LDETGVSTAAESLGLDLQALRDAASEEFHDFWRFLRRQAASRVQSLRNRKSDDPFDWESPSLAAVPAFAEDRRAVEILYLSLRGEIETL